PGPRHSYYFRMNWGISVRRKRPLLDCSIWPRSVTFKLISPPPYSRTRTRSPDWKWANSVTRSQAIRRGRHKISLTSIQPWRTKRGLVTRREVLGRFERPELE